MKVRVYVCNTQMLLISSVRRTRARLLLVPKRPETKRILSFFDSSPIKNSPRDVMRRCEEWTLDYSQRAHFFFQLCSNEACITILINMATLGLVFNYKFYRVTNGNLQRGGLT